MEIDIDQKRQGGPRLASKISSPRSLEAFRRTGVTFKELEPLNVEAMKEMLAMRSPTRQVNPDVLNLRIEYANKARHQKMQLLRDVSYRAWIFTATP